MRKNIRIFMAGVLVIVPLAVTAWLIIWIGTAVGRLGYNLLDSAGLVEWMHPRARIFAGAIGVVIVVVAVWLVGLLANVWVFRWVFALVDRLLSAVPGVRTIYESVRDLLKLFGGREGSLGRVVLYQPKGEDVKMLGIVTNEAPAGRPPGDNRVLVYLPLGYMIGGPILYAPPECLENVDMPAEVALKLAMTAFVGAEKTTPPKARKDQASSLS